MKSTSPTPFIIALIVVVGGMYWYFSSGTEQLPLTVGETGNQAQTKFQNLVSELQSISFNTAIFSDPRFNALVDITTPISPETTGRLDPFAPVAGINAN